MTEKTEEDKTFATNEVPTEYHVDDNEIKDLPPLEITIKHDQKIDSSCQTENNTLRTEEEEEETLVDKALEKKLPKNLQQDDYEGLLTQLKENRDALIEEGRATEASAYNDAYKYTWESYQDAYKRKVFKEAKMCSVRRIANAKNLYDEKKEGYEKEEEVIVESLKKRIEKLQIKHQQQIDDYEREWRDPAKIRKYNKTSGKLKELRLQAKMLMKTHRYNEAQMIEAEANRLQEIETKKQQKQMIDDHLAGLNYLIAQQHEELRLVRMSNDIKISTFRTDKVKELDVCQKRIMNAEVSSEFVKKPDQVWAKKKNTFKCPRIMSTRSLNKTSLSKVSPSDTLPLRGVNLSKSSRAKTTFNYRTYL
ncbi:hypothetical protein TVAG_165350 [Trichomonas vaginalis G3]|uniref:Uncharacterized protein n=1 Tax=Trichomonas vaginalis (strain ATCC PRA-98 / G3) TaxID=412133 RepID=A2DUL6_TRIV3|nr:hypothetical protein TVAGG3_0662910 [Trichomonas vaginalis G3]EAY15907.1 hypothetical protein TVAG_165350 [Trichomonas vaginalis G3]KAI5506632.1 hypothetical protein TVAGG3_0662910 [Trichomonas vaginalis G3]|eukprot:XP_001328130.1 hypothetical protein [Trichomonas vaginalis G3]